ncbi:unnamed protein product [Prunus brigantina]
MAPILRLIKIFNTPLERRGSCIYPIRKKRQLYIPCFLFVCRHKTSTDNGLFPPQLSSFFTPSCLGLCCAVGA